MKVTKSEFETAVRAMQGAANYIGQNKALANASGGNFEDHYVKRDGKRVCVASADATQGSYTVADDIVAKVLPQRVL